MLQENVPTSYEKYEIQILYVLCKYEYNISKKHLKQASKTDKHKGRSQIRKLTIYSATILRIAH